MNKLSKWLFELDMMKGMKYIFVLFVAMTIFSGYSIYDLYKEGDWSLVNHSVSFGIFGLSALYYSIIMFWMKENARRMTQITNLIIENHELEQEIMIMKMPSLAKSMKADSLD